MSGKLPDDGEQRVRRADVAGENDIGQAGEQAFLPERPHRNARLRLSGGVPVFDGCRVTCGAGVGLAALAKESVSRGLSGLEALSGACSQLKLLGSWQGGAQV